MVVKVQLFAYLKEKLGDSVELDLPEPVSVGTLLAAFLERHPEFGPMAANLNVAVDLEYAGAEQQIRAGQEVAIFPPVSGGRNIP